MSRIWHTGHRPCELNLCLSHVFNLFRGASWGMFWEVCWGAFGGVREVLLCYVRKCSGGKNKGTNIKGNNCLMISFDMFILYVFQ